VGALKGHRHSAKSGLIQPGAPPRRYDNNSAALFQSLCRINRKKFALDLESSRLVPYRLHENAIATPTLVSPAFGWAALAGNSINVGRAHDGDRGRA
jgi:hypothetical protein